MSYTQQVRLRSRDNICKTCTGKQNLSYILFLIFYLFTLEEKKKGIDSSVEMYSKNLHIQ